MGTAHTTEKTMPITIKPLTTADQPVVEALLKTNDLPYEDLQASAVTMLVTKQHGELIGCIGYEQSGYVGLLRSLAVQPHHRGQGIAEALLTDLFSEGKQQGVSDWYLLTTTAESYFHRHGFVPIDRESVPHFIRQTAQFSSLCPATATIMRKMLKS